MSEEVGKWTPRGARLDETKPAAPGYRNDGNTYANGSDLTCAFYH